MKTLIDENPAEEKVFKSLRTSISDIENELKIKNEAPEFKFCLREDLKEEKNFLPTRATNGSAGWDCRCAPLDKKTIIVKGGEYVKIPLGFRVISPKGWWLKLNPRSSTFFKKSLHCLYGILDSDFRGEVSFCATYLPDVHSLSQDLEIQYGEAIGQLIPTKLEEMIVKEISNEEFDKICENEKNERGAGGFGSTSDKK